MCAVYSSWALCVNLFHHWSRLLTGTPCLDSKPAIDPLLTACGLSTKRVKSIDFEVPNIVNPRFKTAPHIDVQISFDDDHWKCAGIEAKFCEPYGDQKPGGLKAVYLQQKALWREWPNVPAFAQQLSPNNLTHSHFHAAQLLKHLLGLRMQNGGNFVLALIGNFARLVEAGSQPFQESHERQRIPCRNSPAAPSDEELTSRKSISAWKLERESCGELQDAGKAVGANFPVGSEIARPRIGHQITLLGR
jgi:hypothetical protein